MTWEEERINTRLTTLSETFKEKSVEEIKSQLRSPKLRAEIKELLYLIESELLDEDLASSQA